MAKLIRNREQLRAHLESMREGDTDSVLAARLGLHINTITKLKQGGGAFELPKGLQALGLSVVYEVTK